MSVKDEIGNFCLTMEASFDLVDRIKSRSDGKEVFLDFDGINLFATPFFNGLIHTVSEFTDLSNLKCLNLPAHGKIAYEHAVKNFTENKISPDKIKKSMVDYLNAQNG